MGGQKIFTEHESTNLILSYLSARAKPHVHGPKEFGAVGGIEGTAVGVVGVVQLNFPKKYK